MATPTIFISYSHKDEEWKNKLVNQLGILQQQDYLDIWVDTRIEGGDDWFKEIKEAINATSIAVLLISADFLDSKFITEQEIPLLLQQWQQKGLRIFPIILKPCDWLGVPWIAKSLARPKDGRPLSAGNENQIETDLAAIAREIRELLERSGLPREKREYVPLPPDQVSLSKLPTTQQALFGREKELKLLDDAWQNPHCHVFSFVAFGGVGKTALVNEWLNQMELDNWRGAERVYGWSFYSQGTREDRQASADTFFEDALKFFGYRGEPLKSPWDKGKLLASLIKERKTLLILDGLEPLQYPPGVEEGRLRDQGLQALLKELARFNNGLCVITTRCKVSDIEHTEGKTTHQLELENLSPEAGRQLLREAGVTQGTDKELQQATAEYGGHALALTLLGRYLATVYDGEIRKRDLIPQLTEEMEHGGHAKRVMVFYEIWLSGTPELEILYLMGLFDRPAPLGAINVLINQKRIKGLTDKLYNISEKDWHYTVKHLRDLRLLSASEPNMLDCHPLIREHFSQKLRSETPNAWRMAHERLYDYYKNLSMKKYPTTLREMEPLFFAVFHGCQSGFYKKVWKYVYYKRILRKHKNYLGAKLGAFSSDLTILSNFFEIPWEKPEAIFSDKIKALLLNFAGYDLGALGRLREAIKSMQAALHAFVRQKKWIEAAVNINSLTRFFLILGNVSKSMDYANQGMKFALKSMALFEREFSRTELANALHQSGRLLEAEKAFRKAEIILKILGLRTSPYLYGLGGFYFCDLLLSQGKYLDVQKRTRKTAKIALFENWPLQFALDRLSLGWANLLEALAYQIVPSNELADDRFQKEKIIEQVTYYLNQAVADLRKSGHHDFLFRSLKIRAFLYRTQNDFLRAWNDLTEAEELAELGGMNLHLVDYHLEASRVIGQQLVVGNFLLLIDGKEFKLNRYGMVTRLKMHVKQAADLVQQTGYHRRDPEVELGYAGLFLAQGDQVKAKEFLGKAKTLLDKMGIRCWDFEVRRLEQAIG